MCQQIFLESFPLLFRHFSCIFPMYQGCTFNEILLMKKKDLLGVTKEKLFVEILISNSFTTVFWLKSLNIKKCVLIEMYSPGSLVLIKGALSSRWKELRLATRILLLVKVYSGYILAPFHGPTPFCNSSLRLSAELFLAGCRLDGY